jgi:choline dehydrogenase-like flavoprotein
MTADPRRPDVLVVGAGSAGAVLAARLSEDPARRVLLLEAGPDERSADEPASISGPSFMDACAEPGRTWPDLVVRRTAAQEPRVYQRGRGAGGSSAVNAMVAIPGIAEDYDRWEDLGASGWGWDDLSPWFGRTALVLNPADRAEWGPVNRALVEALPNAAGAVPLTRTIDGRRASTNDVYLEPARDRPNLQVRGECLVDRVLLDGAGRQAVGVRLAGGEEIEAGAVIVSAGAIHSPAILLRSAIDRPAIGHNLRDHAAFPVPIALADGVPWDPGSLAIATLARLSSGEDAADLQLLPLDHVGRDAPNLAMVMVALMRARSKGTVRLASDDATVDPEVDFDMLSDPVDRRRLRTGVERLLEVLDHRAMRAVGTPIVPPHDDAGLDTNLGDYVHAAGTCRIGSVDDKQAVVDPSCQVIGYEGLWVCDASVMPDLPRANTHLTTVVVAERVAAMLAARWNEEGSNP